MNLQLLLPEILVCSLALGVMMWDLWLPRERKGVLWGAAVAATVVALLSTFIPAIADAAAGEGASALGGSFVLDPLALWFKRAFAVSACLVFLMSREYVQALPRGQGEFYTLGLFAMLGMFFCASVNDFMSLFVALEVVTVSFFVLGSVQARELEVGRGRPEAPRSSGRISAAVLLYGIAFIYGATGTVFFDTLTDPETGQVIHTGLRDLLASGDLILSNGAPDRRLPAVHRTGLQDVGGAAARLGAGRLSRARPPR